MKKTVIYVLFFAVCVVLVGTSFGNVFVGNAQLLRKLEAIEKSLMDNAKIVIPKGSELVNVIGDMAGVLPLKRPANE